ncbi:HlyD family type I secretion periplasmic adaptor subunit [Sphingomonas sp. GCM10030256]|uniref:HlyD family type I secretion periplasmic adaptor subunit n=1 Tax=Sphingomonas sp. GCM10030256 TaxID=3273427 RepID=UPI00361EEAA8
MSEAVAQGSGLFAGVGRHWAVLRDSWALESERRKTRQRWRETDFLPAALEVVERPPNPLGRLVLWTLLGFVALAIGWSILAGVDVVAVAPGKVVAVGRNKLVQAAEGGVVRAIHVQEGQQVRKGQPLVTLDPTASGADLAQAAAQLQTAEIDAARSRALLSALRGGSANFVAPRGTPPEIVVTQRQLIQSRLSELGAKVGALQEEAAEASASSRGALAESARLNDTLPFLRERVERRRELAGKGYSSRLTQLELEQQLVDHQRQIDVQQQNAARARATQAAVGQQIAMSRAEAMREILADLTKAEADMRLAREELTKADQRSSFQIIRASVDGTVQQLAVFAEGAVLKPADPILVVVPANAELVVEAQVLNKDIGFVRPGQPVTVKLEAFPFTRFGALEGKLIQVSRDAVQDEQLGPVYTARVAVDPPTGEARAEGVTVSPGLVATAEIRTNERRVIDYLLSPLERRVSEAGRER